MIKIENPKIKGIIREIRIRFRENSGREKWGRKSAVAVRFKRLHGCTAKCTATN